MKFGPSARRKTICFLAVPALSLRQLEPVHGYEPVPAIGNEFLAPFETRLQLAISGLHELSSVSRNPDPPNTDQNSQPVGPTRILQAQRM